MKIQIPLLTRPPAWSTSKYSALLVIAWLLMSSAAIQGVVDVMATSWLVAGEGGNGAVALWAADAVVALVGIVALVHALGGRDPRRLTVIVLAASGLALGCIAVVTQAPQVDAGWWVALGIINTLQSNLVVLLAWNLARTLLNAQEALRLFGPLSALAYLGTLVGTAVVSWTAGTTVSRWLLPGAAAWMLSSAAWALARLPKVDLPSADDTGADQPRGDGQRWWQLPMARWLALVELGNGAVWTMLSLVTVLTLQLHATDASTLQRAFGQLRFVGPLVHAAIQMTLAGPLLARFGFGPLLVATPLVLGCNLAWLAMAPDMTAVWGTTVLLQLAFGAASSANQQVLVRLPAPMQALAGTHVTGTMPQLGYLMGCAMLFGCVCLGRAVGLAPVHAVQMTAVAGLAFAVVNLVAAWQLRSALVQTLIGGRRDAAS